MGPLNGLKVVDLTSMVSGPVAAMMLADQGASVIKVEPLHGEQMRFLGPPVNGLPPSFYSCNRGKESIALDLKSAEGKAVLWQLIEEADVLLQNFRPGAMERMGFGEDAVRARNEGIVYVSISGFGETGPYANQRVYDPVIQALSGATDIQANRITRDPEMFRVIIADKVTSLTAAQAVSSALYHRAQTGEGQHIKLSMLDAMLAFLWPEGMAGLTYAEDEFDPANGSGSMDLIYPTKDGFITAGVISDKEWVGMCKALKREDLMDDERFSTARARGQNAQVRKEITLDEIAKWPSAEILQRLRKMMYLARRSCGDPSYLLMSKSKQLDPYCELSTRVSVRCDKRVLLPSLVKHRVRSVALLQNWVSSRRRFLDAWATARSR